MITEALLERTRLHVRRWFARRITKAMCFHDLEHTLTVTRTAKAIGRAMKLSAQELALLEVAALIHDTGYALAYAGHEEQSAAQARAFLLKAKASAADITRVHGLIMATRLSATPRGTLQQVLRDADTLSLAGIEKGIGALGKAARDGDLTMDQMQGGTFTITNGGTYGSLMSTPILNAPQSGILGMHNIVQRPMAINGEVKIRPMMYLALSYDHRIVDGKEAVTFLVRVKEHLEDPQRFLLDL